MNKRCICPPADFPDTSCPVHGLSGDQSFPPMDRHACRKITIKRPCGFCKGTKRWQREPDEICRFCKGSGIETYTRRETAAECQRRLYEEARKAS